MSKLGFVQIARPTDISPCYSGRMVRGEDGSAQNGHVQPALQWATADSWNLHKAQIVELYKTNTLGHLKEIMEHDHGFKATHVLLGMLISQCLQCAELTCTRTGSRSGTSSNTGRLVKYAQQSTKPVHTWTTVRSVQRLLVEERSFIGEIMYAIADDIRSTSRYFTLKLIGFIL